MTLSRESNSTELIVSPRTGEALSLDSPTEDLAGWLRDVRDYEGHIRDLKRAVSEEIARRCDQNASWTVHLDGGVKVSVTSPAPVEEWNGIELRAALLELVDEGVLSIAAVDAAVETVVTYKPVKAGIQKLRKLGGRVRETVDQLASEREPERRVSVR